MANLITEVYKNTLYGTAATNNKWVDSKYEAIKNMNNTHKGDFGERFTAALLSKIGIPAEVVNGGQGDFDIRIKSSGVTIEHKLATEDVSGAFQFNGIDKDKDYDCLFCLGFSPNEILFSIFPKADTKSLTTNMSKAGGGFKKTIMKSEMIPLTEASLITRIKRIKKVKKNV
jgi:hypothetical protein